jgi:ferredoxin
MAEQRAEVASRDAGEQDRAAGIDVTAGFERFAQRDDVFTRAFWDPTVKSAETEAFFRSYRMEATPRRGDGFTQKDFALRNAAWLISDIVSDRSGSDGRREGFQAAIRADTPVAPTQVAVDDPSAMSAELKQVARLFGADLAGITDFDQRWLYASRVDVRDFSTADHGLPDGLTSVVVLGHAMDQDLVQTYPSALAGAATGRAYSEEAAVVMQVAAYIRNLGYHAVPSMNDTALVIPLALKAGLGEFARNQLVITPEFGPRVRFSKIFTDLPLAHDRARPLGVKAVCDRCTRCAAACPVKALPFGAPTDVPVNRSTIRGVRKWSADAEKCFSYWAKLASDCAICLRVCPFNRDFSRWWNRLWLRVALSPLRDVALLWDDWSKRAERMKPSRWWSARP